HDAGAAYDIWHKKIGLPPERIRRDDEDENFWPAGAPSKGPEGVCGPCSEIFFCGDDGNEVEIWNLVFTQFNRVGEPPDNLQPLPKQNIDTGMGLERTAAVLQGVASNFEIDSLKPLCAAAAEIVGVDYRFEAPQGRAIRRIADHVRAVSFCIHEGVMPGTEKENYVVRQLLRRAQLEGYILGQREPFLHQLVPSVVELMRTAYPDLDQTIDNVTDAIEKEESQFLETVDRGAGRFEQCVERTRARGENVISGQDAFDLHQTEGFFIELTEALASRHEMTVDQTGFESCMQQHRRKSGSGAFEDSVMVEGPLDSIRRASGDTEFQGYETLCSECRVVGIISDGRCVSDGIDSNVPAAVLLDRTPFYGEAGGQVGDQGRLYSDAETVFQVVDTQRHGELVLHIGNLQSGRLQVGQAVTAEVNFERRNGIRRAHSATHLLHHALHQVVSKSATQRGSKVEDDTLRFDFAHKRALTADEVRQLEDVVNQRISEGAAVTTELMELNDARQAGAMALFGEKYPDRVRVVQIGDFSTELCGGTHLENSGQVGFCKIVSEEPVGKGVRRISALTGSRAIAKNRASEALLAELVALLKTPQPEDLPQRVSVLQQELRDAKRQLALHSRQTVAGIVDQLLADADVVVDVQIVLYEASDFSRDELRDLVDQIRAKSSSVAVLVGTEIDGKVALTASISKSLVERGLSASDCVKRAARIAGGGGGGRPELAEAGARFPEKLAAALEEGGQYYREQLQD
ncbi:MAG: alanine--tRNA ligase, partial [Planctomycetaceae bacterium]